jgi:hypothetical protein
MPIDLPMPVTADWLISKVSRRAEVITQESEIVLDNGLIRLSFHRGENLARVGVDQLTRRASLQRAIRPEAEVTIDGKSISVGGLTGQPIGNYLDQNWIATLKADPNSLKFVGFTQSPLTERFPWKPVKGWLHSKMNWPPKGVQLNLEFENAATRVTVHYELYDALPVYSKWLTVTNRGSAPVRLNSFKSEILAATEAESPVEVPGGWKLPNIQVETEFTTCAMTGADAARQTAHWKEDPTYGTQVNYQLKTPCLLEVAPPLGPNRVLKPKESFETFRTWFIAHDSEDADRKTLTANRFYRAVTPWAFENPLIFHVRSADPKSVREAIDEAANVGFELVIMTFGSGFEIENDDPKYLAEMKELVDYGKSKGIALGGYSLLASRSIDAKNDVVNPKTGKPGGFATFDNSPCIGSEWGEKYFKKLYAFFKATGSGVFEHDGSYPGDACASTDHPGHEGYEDSRYRQWEVVRDFYRWCRSQGIYLNVPDWYFLNGSSKTGMGYRETNWSLPRAQQEIIERQNIADGTRYKAPSMGWMFVPLSEYHGGGAAATIEPLKDHLDHYQARLRNLLSAGVQACYRGPRLYDAPETEAMVKGEVAWYKKHRELLESPLILLRRADGRDWDGWIHVAPGKAIATIFNPLTKTIDREIALPLYYTGLTGKATMTIDGQKPKQVNIDSRGQARVKITVPAGKSVSIYFDK